MSWLQLHRPPRLRGILTDAAHTACYLVRVVAEWGQYALGSVRQQKEAKGWVHLPRR